MPLDLRCPYCGDKIFVELIYTGQYSEHRELDGFECASYKCDARWDKHGVATDLPLPDRTAP